MNVTYKQLCERVTDHLQTIIEDFEYGANEIQMMIEEPTEFKRLLLGLQGLTSSIAERIAESLSYMNKLEQLENDLSISE